MVTPPSGNRNDQPNSPFTLDNLGGDPVEMPSVTKLLNRKKLGLVSSPETKTISRPRSVSTARAIPGQPQIQKVQPRKARAKTPKIAYWTQESLAAADDTFQKAVHYLTQKGARQALLLTPHDPVSHKQSNARFDALCAYMTEDKEELWSGLSLSPSLIPDIWEKLFTQGIYEIVPNLSQKHEDESAAFLMRAFGLKATEFFVIIRCGSPNACTGLLALVSPFSLTREIAAAFSAPKSVGRAA
ncbi:MAG: hypothetical protein ACJ763_01590 [Bdellovibrionia bacterium]